MKKNYLLIYLLTLLLSRLESTYQDVIVNNTIVSEGMYSCEQRYNAIKPLLDKFRRPFTILDIGAAQGFFSLKSAYNYQHAVAVMIEGGYYETNAAGAPVKSDELLDICRKNSNLQNLIYLRKHITIEDLEKISSCEHFDVVYALNILHHFIMLIPFRERWKEAVDVVLGLGDYVVIELPSYAPVELSHYIEKKAPHVIGTFNRFPVGALGTMRLYKNSKKQLASKAFDYKNFATQKTTQTIKSTFKEKKLIKADANGTVMAMRNWKAGINFCTFKSLNGVWPEKITLIENFKTMSAQSKASILPEDIIVQGESLSLIKSKKHPKIDSARSFNHLLNLLNSDKVSADLLYSIS